MRKYTKKDQIPREKNIRISNFLNGRLLEILKVSFSHMVRAKSLFAKGKEAG